MQLDIGFGTHRGRKRETNQDTVGVFEMRGLFQRSAASPLLVVADGMGGHRGGAVASHIAVQAAGKAYQRVSGGGPLEEVLVTTFMTANQAILEKSTSTPSLEGMGTTMVAAVVDNESVFVGNVGDSRAYLIRDREIEQISEDHSLIGEQVKANMISKEQAAVAVGRNVITRALGRRETLEVDVFSVDWQAGDVLVLCSDGLWGQVSDGQIATVVTEMKPQPAVEQLTKLAVRSHAPDNIGVIVVERTD